MCGSFCFQSVNNNLFSIYFHAVTADLQVNKSIDHEEEVLQNLAQTTTKQKSVLHELEQNIKLHKNELDELKRSHADVKYQLDRTDNDLVQVKNTPKTYAWQQIIYIFAWQPFWFL